MVSVTSAGHFGNDRPGSQPRWQVRPFREEDTPGLLALYRLVFKRDRSEAEFRWKLLSHAEPIDTIWVADINGTIVGQHAGIPMHVKLGDREVLAVHAVEAMTHPDYRKEGMLTELGGALYSRWRDQGCPFIMGLPHAGWGSRAHVLGYREAFKLRWLSRPLDPVGFIASTLGFRSPAQSAPISGDWDYQFPAQRGQGISVARVQTAREEFDALWRTTSGSYPNSVVRDASWVQWRYLDAPGAGFKVLIARRGGDPAGYAAYRRVKIGDRNIGRIADVFSAPGDRRVVRALVRVACADLRAGGADSVACLMTANSALHSAMRGLGFLLNRGEYDASFIPLAGDLEWASISDRRTWLLTGGDFDVI